MLIEQLEDGNFLHLKFHGRAQCINRTRCFAKVYLSLTN